MICLALEEFPHMAYAIWSAIEMVDDAPSRNRILGALPPTEYTRVSGELETFALPMHTVLYEADTHDLARLLSDERIRVDGERHAGRSRGGWHDRLRRICWVCRCSSTMTECRRVRSCSCRHVISYAGGGVPEVARAKSDFRATVESALARPLQSGRAVGRLQSPAHARVPMRAHGFS